MGARPYDPSFGRFLSVDPIDGGSLNNYDYAGQDPINGYDLDGTCIRGFGWFCRNATEIVTIGGYFVGGALGALGCIYLGPADVACIEAGVALGGAAGSGIAAGLGASAIDHASAGAAGKAAAVQVGISLAADAAGGAISKLADEAGPTVSRTASGASTAARTKAAAVTAAAVIRTFRGKAIAY
jgi:hypothetical protein